MLPIILIHGFPLDARMWTSQVEFLRGRGDVGGVVLTPNLPGFGGTPPLPREQTSMEAFAREIHQVIVREAEGKAIVGGFSMGGYVLQELLRSHPEVVAAAMFINTRAEEDTPVARDGRLQSINEITQKGTAGLIDAMLGKLLAKQPSPAVKDQVRAIMASQSPEGIIHAQLAMSQRRNQTDLLARLTLPVLILAGAEDATSPPSVALSMQSHMPQAMLVQIASAGHMAPMEQPAAVNAAIETFLTTTRSQ
ncbi:MAG: alpha/beta hydrolase [Phycisphaerales bacterium]|nr:alpha/beta hydrolase [Phycisphaerales bacterium]